MKVNNTHIQIMIFSQRNESIEYHTINTFSMTGKSRVDDMKPIYDDTVHDKMSKSMIQCCS